MRRGEGRKKEWAKRKSGKESAREGGMTKKKIKRAKHSPHREKCRSSAPQGRNICEHPRES